MSADARVLARMELEPDHAQVELADAVDSDYPQWERGDEPAVASSNCIAVATRPEDEGPVTIEVWSVDPGDAPPDGGTLVCDTSLTFSGGEGHVGSYLAGTLVRFEVRAGTQRVRVYVDEPGYATRIAFAVER